MDKDERRAYERYLINRAVENDVLLAAHLRGLDEGRVEGHAEGRAEGEKEGIRQGKVATAQAMLAKGLARALVAEVMDSPVTEIDTLGS